MPIRVPFPCRFPHQKGIIHRDLKPTNVLVTLHDGRPVPKIIDFGIAKAIKQRLTEKTLFTQYAQLIGTPEYMSPEQAEWSGLDVDTRTDIYSLGVLLYELLTGTTPFDAKALREASYSRMQKIICEEEPTKPSTKLSGLGETLAEVARHRKASPDLLQKLVRGDLDWIVMKAMEKNRVRRYETAVEFGADITRYRNHEPVIAAAPSTWYKLRKFVRRNRAAVAAVCMMALILIAGITTTTIGFLQARKQRNLAIANLELAETNFDKAHNAVDKMIQVSSWEIAGASTREMVILQLELLDKGQSFYQEFLEDNLGDQQMWENYGRSFKNQGEKYIKLGNHKQAESAYRKAIEMFDQLKKDYSDRDDYQREIACGWSGLSYALSGQGKNQQAEEAKQVCFQLWQPTQTRYRFGTPANPGRPFNTEGMDGTPSQRADGLEMFFGSNRSGGRGDVWYCQRASVNDPWSEPVNTGLVKKINTFNYEGKPNVSADGRELYFMAEREEGFGSCDIWVSKRMSIREPWGEPENLGPIVNCSYWDGTPCLAEEGHALYFESGRVGSVGGGDLWVTKRASREAPWGNPVNLGPPMNSPYSENTPCLSRDGLLLLFSSTRPVCFGGHDLWMTTRETIDDPWSQPVNLGPDVNTLFLEGHPGISFDGSILFLTIRDHPGGLGHLDMWQVPIQYLEDKNESVKEIKNE